MKEKIILWFWKALSNLQKYNLFIRKNTFEHYTLGVGEMKGKFKKLYIAASALSLILAVAPVSAESNLVSKENQATLALNDLDAATKAKFDALISAGIFDGVSDSQFGINESMNRAQFAKVAALIFGLEVNKDLKTSSFSDVKADDLANGYALPYIEALKKAGITTGLGDGTFNPNGELTKQQLAAFLVRGLGLDNKGNSNPQSNSSDPTVSDWAKNYVAAAIKAGLLTKNENGSFGGKEFTRQDLILTSSFEAKRLEESKLALNVTQANFVKDNKLEIDLSVAIDKSSIDLAKIKVNGQPLDPKLDSFELSEDKKKIIVKLHTGFSLDLSTKVTVEVEGLRTLFNNEVKKDENKPVPVVIKETPVVPVPTYSTPIYQVPTNNSNTTEDTTTTTEDTTTTQDTTSPDTTTPNTPPTGPTPGPIPGPEQLPQPD